MVAQEVLERAIQKAKVSGWEPYSENWHFMGNQIFWEGETTTYTEAIRSFIYGQEFAKALWGEEPTYSMTHYIGQDNKPHMIVKPRWEVELQDMVIAPDPIKYLEEHLDD
jgi:hypothetical protein